MMPRKRSRPNPADSKARNTIAKPSAAAPVEVESSPTSQSQAAPSAAVRSQSDQMPTHPGSATPQGSRSQPCEQNGPKEIRKAKSWYGSWPRPPKATASTSVAKENILGGTVRSKKAADLSRFDTKKDSDAGSIMSTAGTLSALPKIPEAKLSERSGENEASEGQSQPTESDAKTDLQPPITPADAQADAPAIAPEAEPTTPQQPPSSWLGWWSKTPFTETQIAPATGQTDADMDKPDSSKDNVQPRPVTPENQTTPPDAEAPEPPKSAPPSSWFGFWGASGNPPDDSPSKSTPPPNTAQQSEDVNMTDAPAEAAAPTTPHKHEPAPKAGSTWAFWAKDSPKTKTIPASHESGEIAIIGDGSEADPKPMEECDVSQSPTKGATKAAQPKDIQQPAKSTWRKKRVRPQSMDIDSPSPSPSGASTPLSSTPRQAQQQQTQQEPVQPAAPGTKADSSNKSIAESELSVASQANLLLPSFSSTYRMKDNPSILKQIAQFLLRTKQAPTNQLVRIQEPPRIRKAIAIGVHGLFPASYLRPMIGQPTGTSLRFAGLCADAIRRWADEHGCGDCEIEKVALEGEGKIKDRVENLWKLMLNWIDHIRSADLIVIACHSQGVPVAVILLEKLIDLGIITDAKIGVCAMAGVALGPFPEYKSGLLMGSAAELWEFGNPDSENSKRFEASLKRVVDHGARITFIGSIDDQLVPMESAIYSPADHPYIYRAVFIDGRVHAPDFIAHLVGFALKLRNLGVSDHGLIRELSIPLAGSLYSGAGHSRLYYDAAVYDLAVSHVLETTVQDSGPLPACHIAPRKGPLTSPNPYVLPWIMRGLLEEDFVRTELSSEAAELLRQFDDWKPTNKALKDVKYRLEAIRSKL